MKAHWARGGQVWWLVTLVLAGGIGGGCRSVKVLYRDAGFRAASLQADRLAVAGVTPTEATRGYLEQDHLTQMLCQQLLNRWTEGQILRPEEVCQALGTNAYQGVMDSFFENSMLDLEALSQLSPLAQKARYLLLLDLRRSDVDKATFSGVDWGPQGEFEGYYAGSSARRQVWCVFMLYDLGSGKPVWIATGQSRGHASNYRSSWWPVSVRPVGPPAASDLMPKVIRRAVETLAGR